ncbi:MAG TPA: response regulator [Pyrinomonadaceae bacterium]|jgi:CheY-like chemotaxis protein
MLNFLLVEDDPSNKTMLENLAELGLSAELAADGERAMQLLKTKEYEGIILDLQLPSQSGPQGLQILEWVSGNKKDTAIVAVTALTRLGVRALELGVDVLLYKPVEEHHIVNYMMRAVELRKLRLENKRLKDAVGLGIYQNPIQLIELVCSRFHTVARQLHGRYNERSTLIIADEYDVQDLLHSLLRLFFDDIRAEEWTPSYAGGASRVDFLLKQERIVIEVKKTRPNLGAKQVGEQLIIDIARYKAHPDCKTLYCFIYDPEGRIANPQGIENDLSQGDDSFTVKVQITPKNY